MIALTDYINLFDFEKNLIKHLEIEHYFECFYIYENYGLFNSREDLISIILENIYNEIKKYPNKTSFNLSINNFNKIVLKNKETLYKTFISCDTENKFIDCFIKEIELYIKLNKTGKIQLSYNPIQNNYDVNIDKLEKCVIFMEFPKNELYSNEVKKQLAHELTHAYEDYNRIKRKKKTLFDILSSGVYKNAIRLLSSKEAIKQFIGNLLYWLNQQEQNAYIAELSIFVKSKLSELELNKSNKEVANQLFNILKKSKIYKTYYELGSIIELLEDGKLDNIIPKLVTEYNKATTQNKSENDIIKELTNSWNKIQRKIENKLPKIIYKYINDEKPNRFYF